MVEQFLSHLTIIRTPRIKNETLSWISYTWLFIGYHTPGYLLDILHLAIYWISYNWLFIGYLTPGYLLDILHLAIYWISGVRYPINSQVYDIQ